jgi:TBC domain-containing protein kinase-like protein
MKRLLAFHDPELASHLERVHLHTDLYAVPWLLTVFARKYSISCLVVNFLLLGQQSFDLYFNSFLIDVYDLDKVKELWDRLLCGPSKLLPLIAVALLSVQRERLLKMSFNECILFFSNMPDIHVPTCIDWALWMHRITPPSLFKIHSHPGVKLGQHPEDRLCHISWEDITRYLASYGLLIDIRSKKQ